MNNMCKILFTFSGDYKKWYRKTEKLEVVVGLVVLWIKIKWVEKPFCRVLTYILLLNTAYHLLVPKLAFTFKFFMS